MKVDGGVEYQTPLAQELLYELVIASRVGGLEAFLVASSVLCSEVLRFVIATLVEKEGASL